MVLRCAAGQKGEADGRFDRLQAMADALDEQGMGRTKRIRLHLGSTA